MRCLLIQVTRNKRGQALREGRIVEGTTLSIGRGSDCAIFLPHPRVNLLHAVIRTQDDGRLLIEGHGAEISVNGGFVHQARLRPGTHIAIGPYELEVELAGAEGYPEHDFALTVERTGPLEETGPRVRRLLTLRAAGVSRRGPAWLLGLAVLAGFLIWPVVHATKPKVHEFDVTSDLYADASWNPGQLASGHRGFGTDCQHCHQKPFQHVADAQCSDCHRGTGDHIGDKALQKVAFGSLRCAECHRDHRGPDGMKTTDPTLCVSCHSNVEERVPGSKLPVVKDFKTDHPPFVLTVRDGPKPSDFIKVSEGGPGPLRQDSGLKFPHDVHLAPRGVKSPMAPPGSGGRVKLNCASCHVPEESGVGFKPVTMEAHCASCHQLQFEPGRPDRVVPHGDVAAVVNQLRDFYGSAALGAIPLSVTTDNGLLQALPARAPDIRRQNAITWANTQAMKVAQEVFEVRVCVTCHTVRREADDAVPWSIAPVRITTHWMPGARFEHAAHAAADCKDCHRAANSHDNRDILMPTLSDCRQCHVGATPEPHKVTSDCSLCHGFHRHPDATMPGGVSFVASGSRP